MGGYRVPVTPSFNASSGVFRGALNASVGSCGSQSASIRLEYWSVFQSSKQFKISSAGEYLVTVREAISYVLNLSATSGGTGESAFANGSVDSFGYLYNVSSGSEYSINQSEASFSLAERVGAGNLVSHARSFSITLANATTLPQGKYVAYLEWALVVSVWVSAAPVDASTAAADLNMGYSDRQASVESIGIP